MILSYTAVQEDAGRKVYSVLRRELALSSSMVRSLKHTGGLCVDGQEAFTDHLLRPGETVTADVSRAEPPCDVIPQDGELEILWEDDGLLAVNKAPGVLVHPSHARNTDTLANFVCGYLRASDALCGCHAVGRLDRDTSGAVLFAKNSYMMFRLSKRIENKTYLAAVCGCPPEERGVIDLPIRRRSPEDMARIVAPDGQRAVTHYELLRSFETFSETVSLLRLRLETGRTHQIRVHCLELGMPLLGDVLYATDRSRALSEKLQITAQTLHASGFSFVHPLTGERVEITAPLRRVDMLSLFA